MFHEYSADPSQYEISSVIGTWLGGLGTIFVGWNTVNKNNIVIKKLDLELCQNELQDVQHELILMRNLRHNNLLPCLTTFLVNSELWIINPLMDYGSAEDLLKAHFTNGLPESSISCILYDILQSLIYLHKDLRTSHILIGADGYARLSGLRHSILLHNGGQYLHSAYEIPLKVPLQGLSPEMLQQNMQGYNHKTDIYSLGIAGYELAFAITPFDGLSPTLLLLEKLEGQSPSLSDSTNFNGCTYTFSSSFHTFINACLQKDPKIRPTSLQLASHSFIRNPHHTNLLNLLHTVLDLPFQMYTKQRKN